MISYLCLICADLWLLPPLLLATEPLKTGTSRTLGAIVTVIIGGGRKKLCPAREELRNVKPDS
jgi:hypothetical protein